ncbi:hypothetical protein CF392_13165 [Tamilnaduibacter salinus]|uniref:Calx-beta domain-containing protein n=1 Tax=Tamilnaduibacter salinus TaxID=1484056 RepID=A0A2A2I1Y9_9GAMM|nr:hypothetical protein [Tamilnaduibacter salinus]PAV25013.1 hypothetical protein CF392_13165 [Tamilnaduibacter salinus]
MYKKILLSSAIAAALGTSGVAHAAVDLDQPNGQNPLVFAEEIAVGSGVDLNVTAAGTNGGGDSATAAAVEVDFGFTIGQGTSKYVRLGFDQPLAAALVPADFGDDSAAAATYSISQGGQAGDSFVIVEVAAPTGGADVLQDDRFAFQPQDGDEIEATDQNTRSISYDLYETAVDAVNETNLLVSKSGQWITWGPGYDLTCTSANPSQIDVVDPTQFVDGTNTTNVSNLNLSALNVFTEGGTAVTIPANYFGAGAEVVVEGSTEAFETAAGFTLNTVAADAAPANGSATWTATADPAAELNGVFAVTADGTNEMVQSNYTLSVTDTAGAATYDVGTVSTACGNLQFSGSTDRLDFALTPNGAFQQLARITNPSGTAGDVTVTVINDDGDQVSFDLGDINGVASNSLDARASTKLINIDDIYAAAQAADPAFAIAATGPDSKNKLRVVVRGEFGGDAVEGYSATDRDSDGSGTSVTTSFTGERLVERREDGIYIQGLTVSRDNNAFFQTK